MLKVFSHTLIKIFGRHFQTFQKLFPTLSNFIQTLSNNKLAILSQYSQTRIGQPLLGPLKTGCLGQVVIL